MTPLAVALLAALVTLVASLLLPFPIRPLLIRLGIMDVPNERSSHDRPVLRGLGLAVLVAMTLGGASALLAASFGGAAGWEMAVTVMAGSLAAGLLGMSEDLRGLSVPVRSAVLLLIAAGSTIALMWLASGGSSGPTLSMGLTWGLAGAPWWGLILLGVYGTLFISSYINVANFMDGLNGISGLHGVLGGLTFATVGWLWELPWLCIIGSIIAAAYAGFLPWNLTKPGAFLGDVGSYLLGGATAITSLAAFIAGVPLLATIGPMVLYFGDVAVTLVKRIRDGHKWDEPHKEHVYQRIQQLGYSHLQASAITASCTVLTSLLGILALYTHIFGTFTLFAAGFIVLVFYLMLPQLLPDKRTLNPQK